ncbi:MAG TPA: tRNA pseudouridine(55) synthase TruB [Mobilitalea sp.]|nr:tRNA pseudouridine(55) synthase TruB [Mobilitalea sp.]
MVNGIINIYKEKGYTSHDVVAKMRGILKMKKIGHTGTLDPEAEGVLPVCMGKATKLVDLITDKAKTYEAVLKLGIVTDTQDLTGQILRTSEVTVGLSEITEVILSYIGEYDQLPPMYSAIKVNGQRLYELARQGKEIERNRRRVIIKDIRILDYSACDHEVRVSVDCGKGTYIRTLLHDIGETLGCGGAMKSLIRTRVGNFRLEEALKLAEVEELVRSEQISAHIIPVEAIFHNYQKITVDKEYDKLLHNGNPFRREHIKESSQKFLPDTIQRNCAETTSIGIEGNSPNTIQGYSAKTLVRVYDSEDEFMGIYRFDYGEDSYRPVKMFL